jgi:hypothetical protein
MFGVARGGRSAVCLAAVAIFITALAGSALAARVEASFAVLYGGQTNLGGRVSFQYVAGDAKRSHCVAPDGSSGLCNVLTISGFQFASRCATKGTTVSATLTVNRGHFSYSRNGVTVSGSIGPRSGQPLNQSSPPRASGSARLVRACCKSGALLWHATPSA